MTTVTKSGTAAGQSEHLHREVGFWGLLFVSLGSIIGSGWLLGAFNAARLAGPASVLSWIVAAAVLAVLALIHAELGAAYPVAGGTARYPFFAFGSLTGFTAGWMAWVQAVAIAPIEVEATLTYSAGIGWVKHNVTMLNATTQTLTVPGLIIASVLLLLFTVINLAGVRVLADTNSVTVVWKVLVPLLTIVVVGSLSLRPANFTAGGGFAPYGAHGVFAALATGVVFALQGFEQAIQMAGEARDPQRDISRAVIAAMIVGVVVYTLLEIVFIGALDPLNLAHGWSSPIGKGDFGPYAELATALGAGWLAVLLYLDAVISPAGAGLVYVATSSRLSYAMGHERALPRGLARISRRGVPLNSVLLAFVVGEIAFLPFPSWQSLVNLVTDATVVMYAFAPVALHALRRRDGDRLRPYRLPAWRVLSPLGFAAANLIIYCCGFEANWKLGTAILVGLVLFGITRRRTPATERRPLGWRYSLWVWPWLAGLTAIGCFGRYGGTGALPEWWDLLVVSVFALVVYYTAVSLSMPAEDVAALVEAEERGEVAPEPAAS